MTAPRPWGPDVEHVEQARRLTDRLVASFFPGCRRRGAGADRWWTLWIAGGLVSNVGARLSGSANSTAGVHTGDLIDLVASVLLVVAAASLHIVLVRLRDLDPAADRATFEGLWRVTLAPAWPLLPDGLDLVRVGLVAEQDGYVAGAVAIDLAGSILLLLVDPKWQRRGIGTTLLESATSRLLAAGVRRVHLGSGGHGYIWPGVPADLPAAVQFFESRGWTWDHQVTDLTADLHGYVAPGGVRERPAYAGVRLAVAGPGDLAEVLAFERRHFPEWLRFLEESGDSVLLARDARGEVVGSLLFTGPGRCSVFWPMLGGEMATIGCVGVAEPARKAGIGSALVVQASELLRDAGAGTCHIGWAWLPAFYERLGYRRWRDYLMANRSIA